MKIEPCDFETLQTFLNHASKTRHVVDKNTLIRSACEGMTVLDIGSIDHSWKTALELGDAWPFRQISQIAKSVVGLDLLAEDARILREHGFNIVHGNAENFDLGRQFDTIICGDIIEHLSNIGSFLNSVARHMGSGSICVITTPNAFDIEQTMLALFHGRVAANAQHTVWLDPQVMYEAVSRSPLSIVGFYWIRTRFERKVRRFPYAPLANFISDYIRRKRPLCNRDFAVILKQKRVTNTSG